MQVSTNQKNIICTISTVSHLNANEAGCLLKLPSGGSVCYAWDTKSSFTEICCQKEAEYCTPPPPSKEWWNWARREIYFFFFQDSRWNISALNVIFVKVNIDRVLVASRLSIYASVSSHMMLSCLACSSMWTGLHGKRGGLAGWRMRIIFVYGASGKEDTEISSATGSVCQFIVRSIHICRDIPGTCSHIVHWWDVSLQIDWFRIKGNYISRWSALSSYLCKCGN